MLGRYFPNILPPSTSSQDKSGIVEVWVPVEGPVAEGLGPILLPFRCFGLGSRTRLLSPVPGIWSLPESNTRSAKPRLSLCGSIADV